MIVLAEIRNWVVSVTEVTDEKAWIKDTDMEYEHKHSKDHCYGVLAKTAEQALDEVLEQWSGKNWYHMSTNEPVGQNELGQQIIKSHDRWNDDLFSRVYDMYR